MYILWTEPNLEPPPYNVPVCPVCGYECEIHYLGINRDVVMCDVCFDRRLHYDDAVIAWEAME